MSQTEIFDEFVRDLINKVSFCLVCIRFFPNHFTSQVTIIQQRAKQVNIMSPEDAIVMTNITNSLELFPLIRQKMSNHKHNVERQANDVFIQRRGLKCFTNIIQSTYASPLNSKTKLNIATYAFIYK